LNLPGNAKLSLFAGKFMTAFKDILAASKTSTAGV